MANAAITWGWNAMEPMVQNTSGPLKVKIPLSADMPVPVRTVKRPLPRITSVNN